MEPARTRGSRVSGPRGGSRAPSYADVARALRVPGAGVAGLFHYVPVLRAAVDLVADDLQPGLVVQVPGVEHVRDDAGLEGAVIEDDLAR